jgi:hypothetical protein
VGAVFPRAARKNRVQKYKVPLCRRLSTPSA